MSRLKLWLYFLRLGCLGFGGPLALIAQIQTDLVEREKLIELEEFRRALSLIKSLPGPIVPQVVAFLTRQKFGIFAALVACVVFIAPATIMMALLAAYYTAFQASPHLALVMVGMQGAALVLIATALYPLAKDYTKQIHFWVLAVLAFLGMAFWSVPEPLAILGMGLLAIAWSKAQTTKGLKSFLLWDLALVCLKAGGLAFGTGIAIIPMLQSDFVQLHGWISNREFMDAIAFGQLTPGPITVTVTFVGYKIAGWSGALVATVAVFAPGIFNVTTWFPRAYLWFSRQQWVKAFVSGSIAAICAGIILALRHMLIESFGWQLLVPSLLWLASFRWKIPSWAVVVLGGLSWFLVKSF